MAGGFFTPEPLGSSSLREEEDNKEMAWTESVMASVHTCMYIQARSTSTEQSRVQYSVLIPTPPGPVLYLFVRVLQGNAEIYCEELTHTMMEAEKSYRRPEARKASGVVPVLSPKA